jgi:hypothetical protein
VCRNEDDDHLYIGDAIIKGNNSLILGVGARVTRWYKPKIPIWVNFGGSCNGRW